MSMKVKSKTNARAFDQVYLNASSKQENKLRGFFESTLRRIKRHVLRINVDDFNWKTYSETYYGPEQHREQLCYTTSIDELDFIFQNNKLYTISDGKPIHYVHRSVYESICNLPTFSSVAEIGLGNGKHLVNLNYILGPDIKLYGFDISQKQINLFHKTFIKEGKRIETGVLDITKNMILKKMLPEVVFACTVLMHIKRPDAYIAGLRNFLLSASRYAVIIDHMGSHDYFKDLMTIKSSNKDLQDASFYYHDTGAYIAIVISLKGESLAGPYKLLDNGMVLTKYVGKDSY